MPPPDCKFPFSLSHSLQCTSFDHLNWLEELAKWMADLAQLRAVMQHCHVSNGQLFVIDSICVRLPVYILSVECATAKEANGGLQCISRSIKWSFRLAVWWWNAMHWRSAWHCHPEHWVTDTNCHSPHSVSPPLLLLPLLINILPTYGTLEVWPFACVAILSKCCFSPHWTAVSLQVHHSGALPPVRLLLYYTTWNNHSTARLYLQTN